MFSSESYHLQPNSVLEKLLSDGYGNRQHITLEPGAIQNEQAVEASGFRHEELIICFQANPRVLDQIVSTLELREVTLIIDKKEEVRSISPPNYYFKSYDTVKKHFRGGWYELWIFDHDNRAVLFENLSR